MSKLWLWAIPAGSTSRMDEKPLTSMALTPEQVNKVKAAASKDGWHSFRTVKDDNGIPDFTKGIRTSSRRDRIALAAVRRELGLRQKVWRAETTINGRKYVDWFDANTEQEARKAWEASVKNEGIPIASAKVTIREASESEYRAFDDKAD